MPLLVTSDDFSAGVDSRVRIFPSNGGPINLISREWSIQFTGVEHDVTYARNDIDAGYVSTLIDNLQADIHIIGFYSEVQDPFGKSSNIIPGQTTRIDIAPERTNPSKMFIFTNAVFLNVTPSSTVRGVTMLDFTARSNGRFILPKFNTPQKPLPPI